MRSLISSLNTLELYLIKLWYSVSSVKTLEEAKVAPDCIYLSMPVQDVSVHPLDWYRFHTNVNNNNNSMGPFSSANSKRYSRKVISLRWNS